MVPANINDVHYYVYHVSLNIALIFLKSQELCYIGYIEHQYTLLHASFIYDHEDVLEGEREKKRRKEREREREGKGERERERKREREKES